MKPDMRASIENNPRQQHDGKSERHQRGEYDSALRPWSERIDKGRDFDVGRRIADEAVIGAKPYVDGQHHGAVHQGRGKRAAEIAPRRAKAEYGDVVDRAGGNEAVCGPERPEHRRRRSGGERRLHESLQRQRRGPEIQSGARPAPAGQQSQRRDQAVPVADLQRQAGAPIEAVPIPPNVVGEPVTDGECRERAPQYAFAALVQRAAEQSRRRDRQRADGQRERVQPAVRNEDVHPGPKSIGAA
jgi:hypothetical protein